MSLQDSSVHDNVALANFLELGEPSAELLEQAQLLVGESPDTRTCAVQNLSDMIYEKGEVEAHRMDEEFLIRFLRARHFDVERSHQLMAKYYEFKKNNPSYIKGVSPWCEAITYIKNEEIISTFPYRDQLGRRILVFKIGKWNTSLCTVDDLLKASLMILECALLEQRTQICGGVCFFDMKDLSMRHTFQVTPSVANKIMQLMGLSFPIRVLEVHILNQPRIFDVIFAMFKPFLNKKMQSMIHFHGSNFKTLHKFIEPRFLPEEYQGTQPHYNVVDWINTLTTHPAIVKELETLGYADVVRKS